MSEEEFKALLDWYAASGTWDGWKHLSAETCGRINAVIDRECKERGLGTWPKAKHDLDVKYA